MRNIRISGYGITCEIISMYLLTTLKTCIAYFSVVTVIEIGTETAVFQQNRTEPKPRFYAFLLTVLPMEQL